MDAPPLEKELNHASLENLLKCLDRVYTDNNLFVISQSLSQIVNYLSPFLTLKKRGKFEELTWLDKFASNSELISSISNYGTLIIVLDNKHSDLLLLKSIWDNLGSSRQRVTLIVKNLTRYFYYDLCAKIFGADTSSLLDTAADVDLQQPSIRMSAHCRLMNWETYPICVEDFVFTLDMDNGGLDAYLNDPINLVSGLSEALAKLISKSTSRKDIIKLKNAYAKGDHSSLLLNIFLNSKLPELISSLFTANEAEFYSRKLTGNTDLVVLERNLDYFPLVLSHMNYLGLLDDLFGITDEYSGSLSPNEKLSDELYDNLKHLNFGSIGAKLNKLAKYLQLEYSNSDKLSDLREIKELVKNLGNLTTKHELVKKHTTLSELVLNKIKADLDSEYTYNYNEKWLQLQNEIFDLDYRLQTEKVHSLMNLDIPQETVLCATILISLINDGIRKKDLDAIERDLGLNYGSQPLIVLRNLIEYKLVKINTKGNDFFGAFTFGKTELETMATTTTTITTTATNKGPGSVSPAIFDKSADSTDEISYEDINMVGVSGGQDVYKSTYTLISKFWNLHPLDEDENSSGPTESVSDYTLPSFALTGATVPLLARMVESLYSREFLKYKPVNSVYKRPNWVNLNLDTMFKGQTVDRNLCDELDNRKNPAKATTRQEFVIVVILGGITRSEISALAYLQGKLSKKILVLTSGIVNTKKLMTALG